MKKFLMALIVAAGCLSAGAGEGESPAKWESTLKRVGDLSGDTGIAGFCRRSAPAYITGEFAPEDRVDAYKMVGKDPHNPQSGYKTPNGYVDKQTRKWVGGYFDGQGTFVKGHEV